MRHRHLVHAPSTPAGDLPSAAIVDLLDRGDVGDWQPLLAAMARAPDGALATRVLALVDRFPMYGTSRLIRAWIDRARSAGRLLALAGADVRLKDLRRRRGLTQVQLAARLGMRQSDLSKLERRRDARLSTLRAYVEALGGRLVLLAGCRESTVSFTLEGAGEDPAAGAAEGSGRSAPCP